MKLPESGIPDEDEGVEQKAFRFRKEVVEGWLADTGSPSLSRVRV